jgi:hypothetical protein
MKINIALTTLLFFTIIGNFSFIHYNVKSYNTTKNEVLAKKMALKIKYLAAKNQVSKT